LNCIPGTTLEEGAVRPLARAELAADAKVRIDFNAAVWIVVGVGNPEHTSVDGAVFHARRRPGAASTVVEYNGDDLGFLFPQIRTPMRHGLALDHFSSHLGCFNHRVSVCLLFLR